MRSAPFRVQLGCILLETASLWEMHALQVLCCTNLSGSSGATRMTNDRLVQRLTNHQSLMSGSYSINTRLLAFSAGIIGLAVLIAWAAKTSWDQLEALHERMQEESLRHLRIADEFQASIYRLNYTLVRLGAHEATG